MGDVDGVLYMNGAEPEIWIHENGINQTVLQYVVDEIVHTSAIMEKRVQNEIEQGTMPDIEALYKDVMEQVARQRVEPGRCIPQEPKLYDD